MRPPSKIHSECSSHEALPVKIFLLSHIPLALRRAALKASRYTLAVSRVMHRNQRRSIYRRGAPRSNRISQRAQDLWQHTSKLVAAHSRTAGLIVYGCYSCQRSRQIAAWISLCEKGISMPTTNLARLNHIRSSRGLTEPSE